jgi:hypothetical protein
MIGKWLSALVSMPTRQIRVCGGTGAWADFVLGSKGHGL